MAHSNHVHCTNCRYFQKSLKFNILGTNPCFKNPFDKICTLIKNQHAKFCGIRSIGFPKLHANCRDFRESLKFDNSRAKPYFINPFPNNCALYMRNQHLKFRGNFINSFQNMHAWSYILIFVINHLWGQHWVKLTNDFLILQNAVGFIWNKLRSNWPNFLPLKDG